MTDKYLTTEELAQLIKVPEETIRHWRKVHYGPVGRRFGRHVRYPLSEVDAFVKDPEAYPRGPGREARAS